MEVVKFNRNQVVFREGEFSDSMYDITWGSVGIYVNYGKPNQKQLAKLTSGDFFGELGLIDSFPRSATAVALEDETTCKKLNLDDISDYFKDKPAKIVAILQHTGERLRSLSKDYMKACSIIEEYLKEGEKKSASLIDKMKSFIKNSKK